MNTAFKEYAASKNYEISSTRMEIDRFIIPAVTIFIALLLFFFMLFTIWSILQLSFFKGGQLGISNFTLDNFYKYFTTSYTLKALWHSLYVSVVTTIALTVPSVIQVSSCGAERTPACASRRQTRLRPKMIATRQRGRIGPPPERG